MLVRPHSVGFSYDLVGPPSVVSRAGVKKEGLGVSGGKERHGRREEMERREEGNESSSATHLMTPIASSTSKIALATVFPASKDSNSAKVCLSCSTRSASLKRSLPRSVELMSCHSSDS